MTKLLNYFRGPKTCALGVLFFLVQVVLLSCYGPLPSSSQNSSNTTDEIHGSEGEIAATSIQNIPLSSNTPDTSNSVLKFNGQQWAPSIVSPSNFKKKNSSNPIVSAMPSSMCQAHQILYYNVSDQNFDCVDLQFTNSMGDVSSLLPSQLSNNGKILSTDGSQLNWSYPVISTATWNTQGTNIYFLGGTVGVGTLAPTFSVNQPTVLDIAGSMSLYGTKTFEFKTSDVNFGGSISIGSNALQYQVTSATYNNISIGQNTLSSSSFTMFAQSNIALGYRALKSNTTGQYNIAMGGSSQSLTVGYYPLVSNTTGSFNIAIGKGSLGKNTTGSQNTCLGNWSGVNNQTSSRNTFIGSAAGLYNNTGSENSCIGVNCLAGLSAGWQNVAYGYESNSQIQNGFKNTSFGWTACLNVSDGSRNVCIGSRTGQAITTGSNNIVIGFNQNANVSTATTSFNINVGNAIFVTAATGTLALPSGQVGLGKVTPTERLDLGGGNIKMGYEIMTNNCGNVASCTVNCSLGKQVLNGGGSCSGSTIGIISNQPSGTTGWSVNLSSNCNTGTFNTYAVCANIK